MGLWAGFEDQPDQADEAWQRLASPRACRARRPPRPRENGYLRGASVDSRTFDRMHTALWARGMRTLTDRTRAMHLSRGGLTVWMVDFSVPRQPATPRAQQISIARVHATYTPAAAGTQQLQLERVTDHRVDRPVRGGALDTEALADQVAAVVLAS